MREFFKKHYKYIFLSLLMAIFVYGSISFLFAEKLELIAYDFRTGLREKPADPNIVIVTIDNRTLREAAELSDKGLGRFPWPRTSYSDVMGFINKGKPKAIILDIELQGASKENDNTPFSDQQFLDDLKKIPNTFFVQLISTDRKACEALFWNQNEDLKKELLQKYSVESIKKIMIENCKVISQNKHNKLIEKFYKKVQDNTINIAAIQDCLNYYVIPFYIEGIYKYAAGIGINNRVKDEDGIVRSLQPLYKYNDQFLFSMPLAVATYVKGNKDPITLEQYKLLIGNKNIPLTKKVTFYFNFRKTVQVPYKSKYKVSPDIHYLTIPFIEVFSANKYKISPEIFKDKIVLIGPTAHRFSDFYNVPNHKVFFGVEALATGIDNLLNDNNFMFQVAPLINSLTTLTLVIAIILVFIFFPRIYKIESHAQIYYSVAPCILALFIFVAINLIVFVKFSTWINFVDPILASIIAIVLSISFSLLVEKDKRFQVELAFSKYVSPQVFKTLISDYKNIDLKASRREVTVLFADIRDFTTFTEYLPPEEVSSYLNEYFTEMVEVILKHNGTVDKFMGDAIMAFFGAPVPDKNHPMQAVTAALEMLSVLEQLNKKWSGQGRRLLRIGIGINTGTVLIGNFGSPKLMDYTVIGDTVNLASRLENLNKEENTAILISAFTYQHLKNDVDVTVLGPKRLKGKTESIVVYELLGLKQ